MDYLVEFWTEGKRASYIIRDMSNPEGAMEDCLAKLQEDLAKRDMKLPNNIVALVLNLEGKIWVYLLKKKAFSSQYSVKLVGKPNDKKVLSKYQVEVLFSRAFPIKSVISSIQLKKLGLI